MKTTILFASLGVGVALLAQKPAAPSGAYAKWLDEDVAYIITVAERARFLRLTSDQERERFIEQFWLDRDPTLGAATNEVREEHYRRIAHSNQRFASSYTAGWRSDRGRIYITLGPADEVESYPGRFERWRYSRFQGTSATAMLEFPLR